MTIPLHDISDDEIVALLAKRGQMMTCVLRNWLSTGRPNLKTTYVRRRLEKLEKSERVERHNEHPYSRQIGWRIVKP